MGEAKEVVERFWEIQDEGDYTKVVNLFAENAILVDPLSEHLRVSTNCRIYEKNE